jgi:hypothetical protein
MFGPMFIKRVQLLIENSGVDLKANYKSDVVRIK